MGEVDGGSPLICRSEELLSLVREIKDLVGASHPAETSARTLLQIRSRLGYCRTIVELAALELAALDGSFRERRDGLAAKPSKRPRAAAPGAA